MTMSFEDFYKLAEHCNENWKGSFTPMEIACNAYDYKMEYDYSGLASTIANIVIKHYFA